MKISPALLPVLEDAAKTMHIKKIDIIEVALVELFWDKNKFVMCPVCESHLAFKSVIENDKPLKRFKCRCGNKVYYDTDNEKLLFNP